MRKKDTALKDQGVAHPPVSPEDLCLVTLKASHGALSKKKMTDLLEEELKLGLLGNLSLASG